MTAGKGSGGPKKLTRGTGTKPSVLDAMFTWPGTGERMTVAKAVPRWIVTTGCTYVEALARCGVSYRTAERWMYVGGAAHRDISDGKLDRKTLDVFTRRSLDFYVDVALASAETVVRWQSILELEGRGGYLMTKTIVKERRNAVGELVDSTTETTTETARPNVEVVMWKMRKQIERYAEKPLIFVGTSPLDPPEPTETEVASSAVASLERYRESILSKQRDGAIEATATEG